MRQTKKLMAAQMKANELNLPVLRGGQEGLYKQLAKAGYVWDVDRERWRKSVKGSTMPDSMFIDDEGNPSGLYRVRVRAHPDEIDVALGSVVRHLEPFVVETSAVEMDEGGVSCRVYVTLRLSAEAKVKAALARRRKEQGQS